MKKLFIFIVLFFACSATIPPRIGSQAISTKSGDNQFGVKDETLPDSLVLTVKNSAGNPISGLTINFDILSFPGSATGQSLSASSDVTDDNGQAGVIFMLGDTLGSYVVGVSTSGDTVRFTLNVFRLKKVILDLQKEIEFLINENIKLIVAHESGISRSFATISGTVISFSATPDATTKIIIRSIFKDNNSDISSKALRIKSFIL